MIAEAVGLCPLWAVVFLEVDFLPIAFLGEDLVVTFFVAGVFLGAAFLGEDEAALRLGAAFLAGAAFLEAARLVVLLVEVVVFAGALAMGGKN